MTRIRESAAMSVRRFYDELTDFYHLIYQDWDASIRRQGKQLNEILRGFYPNGTLDLLDVACGIGTQSIGLALCSAGDGGYRVTGSDLSPASVKRARREAAARGANIEFSTADMRNAFAHHGRRQFDVVIACDNAVPHLLDDEAIAEAFSQLYLCTKEGGMCLISVREYANILRSGTQVHPYGVREQDGKRYVLLQVWDFAGMLYNTDFYLIEDDRASRPITRLSNTTYYAIHTNRLAELMTQAGFRQVRRLDDVYFQPVLIGIKDKGAISP